jgi:hypothetical protein
VGPERLECGRVQHHTNKKGLEGIKESGVIKARDNNLVYGEPARKKPMSVRDAEEKYQITKGKGWNYVKTDAPEELFTWKLNPRHHEYELTVKGEITLKKPTFTKRK